MTNPNRTASTARADSTAISGPTLEVRYRLDDQDRIVSVDDAWLDFARENGALDLERETVLGRSLWDFVSGRKVRLLYRHLLAAARRDRRTIELPFRCDSPTQVRRMTMTLRPGTDGSVTFGCRLLSERERPYLALLDHAAPRSSELLTLCTWCADALIQLDDGPAWAKLETAIDRLELLSGRPIPSITHGICSRCLAMVEEEL